MEAALSTGPVLRMPVAKQARQRMAELSAAPRPELVRAVRAFRDEEWRRLGLLQIERINELTGLDVATSLAAVVDAIIVGFVQRVMQQAGAPDGWQERVGVFAVGGYGRGEFNPYSDLDLLVLSLDAPLPPWLQKANAELQTLLWDVKFQVGASIRAFTELKQLVENDFVTGTALLEQRPLLGGDQVIAAMHALLDDYRRRRARPFLRYKLEELQARRAKAGASIFLMEPNLKTNPGCLRDLQLLRNIAFMTYGSRNLHALRELDTIAFADVQRLFAINDHLLTLRSLLHFHHGRKHDILQMPDQLRVAEQLGYTSRGTLRHAEYLMRELFVRTLHVHQVTELAASRLEALGHLGRRLLLVVTRRKLDSHFSIIDGKIYLADRDFWKLPDTVQRLLAMAHEAQRRGARLSVELQRSIRQRMPSFDPDERESAACATCFRDILGEVGQLRPILQDLHWSGLLGWYLPEFGLVTCHMQFNSYHHYTVDEHTLFGLGELDAIARSSGREHATARNVITRSRHRDLLALGMLLHDVGKYMGRGHVKRGALMVGPVARRLGLTLAEEELVHFLVLHHVTLSDASRTRDINDPALQQRLAEAMGNLHRLDLLYVLTCADTRAVGPGTMTGWQAALLDDLHRLIGQRLEGETREILAISRRDRLCEALQRTIGGTREQIERHVDALPNDYRYLVEPDEATAHYRLFASAAAATGGFAWSHESGPALHHLQLVYPDRAQLLADVATALSGHGLDIQGCRIWAGADGRVLLSLRLQGLAKDKWADEASWTRLCQDLARFSAAGVPLDSYLERRRGMFVAVKAPSSGIDDVEIRLDEHTSDVTILDVRVKDEVGLLGRLCRAIAEAGCDIRFASISTMGDMAVDVFYLTKQGDKLSSEDGRALRRRIESLFEVRV